eukprot:1145207-Pelagomonas_calceolata.AAC.2
MPGIGKCEKLPLDKKQIAKVPQKPAEDITAPIPSQSNPNLQLKVVDWKSWAYTGRSCQVQDGNSKTVIGAVEPNGAGITNTIGRAELAAVAALLTHGHTRTLPQVVSAHFTNSENKPCIQRSTDTMFKEMF